MLDSRGRAEEKFLRQGLGKHGPDRESWYFQISKDGEKNSPALREEKGRMAISLVHGHYQNGLSNFWLCHSPVWQLCSFTT